MTARDPSKHTCHFDGRAGCRECASHRPPDPRYRVPIFDQSLSYRDKRAARAAAARAALRTKRLLSRAADGGNQQRTDTDDHEENQP